MSAQEREILAQSLREVARSQAAMSGRIADELREIYRNLDLRPQIIPVPMPPIVAAPIPQVVMPQPIPQPQSQAGVPPSLETAGIPRFVRDEELPEESWEEGFAGLEPLPAEADIPAGAQPGAAQPEKDVGQPGTDAGDDRQALKDYLAKVREKLEVPGTDTAADQPGAEASMEAGREAPSMEAGVPTAEGPLALLEELGEYLPKRQPERRKNVFMRSDARLKLDYLKSRLEGHKGIMQKIEDNYAPRGSVDSVTLQKVADAFIFIKELAGHYPDPSVGTMMQSKVDSILRRIKR
jgi:hypothetical protein